MVATLTQQHVVSDPSVAVRGGPNLLGALGFSGTRGVGRRLHRRPPTTSAAAGERASLDPPVAPDGRHMWLPGRGRTFVRELAGPPGAPTVVLLHGWTATADLNWWASYAPLATHFHVVALDHRGHGRGIRATSPFRLEQCADDVAALAEVLGLDRIVVVGYSMGGPIAQLVWRRHRSLVAGLVLCATSATFVDSMRERMLATVATGTSAVAGALPIGRLTTAALGKWSGWRDRRGIPSWGYDEVCRHDWAQVLEAGRETLRFDSRRWIGGVDVPAAVVVTEDDTVVPTERQVALAQVLAAPMFRVQGSHAVCTSAPSRFVPALLAACRSVTRSTGASPSALADAA